MRLSPWLIWMAGIGGMIAIASTSSAQQPRVPAPNSTTVLSGGSDCNDLNPGVFPGQTEVAANRIDDDCDGLADEDGSNVPSGDPNDLDQDGFSIAAFDCDDTNPGVHPGAAEIVGNFYDDDCDGMVDEDAGNQPSLDRVDRDHDYFTIAPDRIFASGFELP